MYYFYLSYHLKYLNLLHRPTTVNDFPVVNMLSKNNYILSMFLNQAFFFLAIGPIAELDQIFFG